jgi:hypothetical protein
MAAFRDTTGRPDLRTWELGTYPEGRPTIRLAA